MSKTFNNAALQSRATRLGGNAKPKLPDYGVPKWASNNKQYLSKELILSSTERKERPKYTGTLVIGIATMHKSNAVPVIDQQQAIDIARMRR
jgi:hypothetical protein